MLRSSVEEGAQVEGTAIHSIIKFFIVDVARRSISIKIGFSLSIMSLYLSKSFPRSS